LKKFRFPPCFSTAVIFVPIHVREKQKIASSANSMALVKEISSTPDNIKLKLKN